MRAFAALADPTRRSILTLLAEGEATVNELAAPFTMSLPAISRHLNVLERAGLIIRGREAQWRPSRLQAAPLDEAMEWMQTRKRTWEQTLQVRITREFQAPIEAVFRAWTVPAELATWYGPAQFDTPEDKIHIDLRVGGRYELTMVRRDTGEEMPAGYEILEIREPTLLVLRSDPMPEFGMPEPVITRVEFHDLGGRTAWS